MMKQLVNMKQEAEKPCATECSPMKSDAPVYPYGLRIHLNNKSLEKLGIKELPEVGSKLKLQAVVEVCDISMNESQLYGEDKNMGLQITDMSLSGGSEKEEEGLEEVPATPTDKSGRIIEV